MGRGTPSHGQQVGSRYYQWLGGKTADVIVEEIKSIGAHYPRALRSCKEKVLAKFELKIVPAMQRSHLLQGEPEITPAQMDEFRRRWDASNYIIEMRT